MLGRAVAFGGRRLARLARVPAAAGRRASGLGPGRRRASLASAYAEPEVAAAAAPPSAPAPAADGGVRPPIALDEVYVCDGVGAAEAALARLEAADPAIYHAVDTEVDDIDLSREGPVGNGRVTCFTVYSGPDFSYDGVSAGKALFVDCVDGAVLDVFAPWFADESRRKVWHNYGFDRHVVENHGLACRGFAGDTMHMARLHDSSRLRTHGGDGYSLEALSRDLISAGEAKVSMKALFPEFFRKTAFADRAEGSASRDAARRGLDILRMQTDDATRDAFVCYAAYDAKSTWQVHDALRRRLERQAWDPMTDDPPRSPETQRSGAMGDVDNALTSAVCPRIMRRHRRAVVSHRRRLVSAEPETSRCVTPGRFAKHSAVTRLTCPTSDPANRRHARVSSGRTRTTALRAAYAYRAPSAPPQSPSADPYQFGAGGIAIDASRPLASIAADPRARVPPRLTTFVTTFSLVN